MLNPFDPSSVDAFEVNAFLKGTRFACLEVSSAVFPARAGEDSLRFRSDKPTDTDADLTPTAGVKAANGYTRRMDACGASANAVATMDQPTQQPTGREGSEEEVGPVRRRRRQSPHDSPLLSAALGLGGSMDKLPLDGSMPGFKDN